jgi:hypothetical protein
MHGRIPAASFRHKCHKLLVLVLRIVATRLQQSLQEVYFSVRVKECLKTS